MNNITKNGYYLCHLNPDLQFSKFEYQNYWNNLSIDKYIDGKYKFRERKYSQLEYNPNNNTLKNIGSVYFQEEEFNELYGGQHREFSPVDADFLSNKLFRYLLRYDFQFFLKQRLLKNKIYKMGVHQIRTIAKSQQSGLVTPEGIHKDGHPVFALHLVNRQNINGGVTNLYNNNFEKIDAFTLKNFGDTVCINDNMVYHEVTPISQEDENKFGFRDILIIEFY